MFGLFILKMDEVLFYVVHNDTHEAFESPSKSLLCYLLSYYVMVSFKQFLSIKYFLAKLARLGITQYTSERGNLIIPINKSKDSCRT